MAPRRKWSIEQENWVVMQYQKVPQPTDIMVKREFRKKFYPKNTQKLFKTRPADFRRIFERFQKNGIQRLNVRPKRIANPTTTQKVKDLVTENPRKSVRIGQQELQIPKSTVFIHFKFQPIF